MHFGIAATLFSISWILSSLQLAHSTQLFDYDDAIPLEVQIEGKPEENFRYLAAQCWLPKTKSVRAILCIVLHPYGSNGRILARNREWRKLAHTHDAALLAISIVPSSDAARSWFDASAGSGDALLSAVTRIAQISELPHLVNVPLLVAGVCAAGQFSYDIASFRPDRTLGFVTIGGAKHRIELALGATKSPGLLIVTPDRGKEATSNLESLATLGRIYGAPWIEGTGMISDYDAGYVGRDVLDFIEALLAYQAAGKRKIFAGSQSPISAPFSVRHFYDKPSFLGKPLPTLATSEASQISDEPFRFGIRIKSNDAANVDSISVPDEVPGETSIAKVADNEWQVTFTLDEDAIPTGTFQFEVPIRFASSNVVHLGGLQVSVNGTLKSDIYPRPSSVRIAWTSTERESSFELLSRNKIAISDIEIERIVPGWLSARLFEDGSARVMISPKPDVVELPPTVAGYLILRAKSNKKQRIKIPFYGTINI